MIPKVIHYVWVGNKEKDIEIKRCMKSWEKILKDWEIKEWNENNFDIHKNEFIENAYKIGKYAFVSDYIRAWVIYNYGGIYLDTDIMVLESLENLLDNRLFLGFEGEFEKKNYVSAAIFGAEKKHPLMKDLMDYYDNNTGFTYQHKDNNSFIITNILKQKYGLINKNEEQRLVSGIHVYNKEILNTPSEKSKTVHLVTTTWNKKSLSMKDTIAKRVLSYCNTKSKLKLYINVLNAYHILRGVGKNGERKRNEPKNDK